MDLKSLLSKEISFKRSPNTAPKAPGTAGAKRAKQPGSQAKAAKQIVGLKIGGSQLAAATVVNNGKAKLVQVARDPLEPGVVVGGELRDPEALETALAEFFRRHKLPRKGIRLGIASNRIGVRTFEIAGIEEPSQLTNAIRFRAQETLPIPLDQALLDYHVLEETMDVRRRPVRRVLLVVAYRELVDRFVGACTRAGLRLDGVDLEAFGLLRALAAPRTGADRAALVVVSIGRDRTTFAVSDGRDCQFTRVLEWGGFDLDTAIARAIDSTPSAAEPVKRALGLEPDGDAASDDSAGLSPERAAAARAAIRAEVESFARELVSSLHFYQAQPGSLGISELVLAGGTSRLRGLPAELERLTRVPVRLGDPFVRLESGEQLAADGDAASLAAAIGLGIED